MGSYMANGESRCPSGGLAWLPLAAVVWLAALAAQCGEARQADMARAGADSVWDRIGMELAGEGEAGRGVAAIPVASDPIHAALDHGGTLAMGGRFHPGEADGADGADGAGGAETAGEARMFNDILLQPAETRSPGRPPSCPVPPDMPGPGTTGRAAPGAVLVGVASRNLACVMNAAVFAQRRTGGGCETSTWIEREAGTGIVRLLNPLAVRLNNAASCAE